MTSSVAIACALIAGWMRWPGAWTCPIRMLVRSSAAPIQAKEKADWPCSSFQGAKWSLPIASVKPISSARAIGVEQGAGVELFV